MRKYSALLLTFAAVLALAANGSAQEAVEVGPRIVVPEKIMDLGTVPKGEVVSADFKIINEGSEALQLKAVRPTCGCTVAKFDREVAAGATGWVKTKLDTKDFSGPISKSVLVMSNDQETPTLSLVIKADVKPFVEVLPRPLVRFNAVLSENATEKLILVAEDTAEGFAIEKIESSVPFLETSVRPLEKNELLVGKAGNQYELTLSLTENADTGPLSAQVTLFTNHPKARKVPIRVFGVVRALLHVTPPQLQFGSVEAKVRPGRNLIVVNNRHQGTVELSDARVSDSAFDVQVVPIQEGKRFQVTVTVKPDATAGMREATLTIDTTDPDYPEITVPIQANIR